MAPASAPPPPWTPEQQALHDALGGLLSSVARLAVSRGLPFAAVDELLKAAFVQAAGQAHPGLLAHRKVSRISTATGINRREVTRLTQAAATADLPHARSAASEVFTHWRTQRPYRGSDGEPKALPRQGRAPSFESLAQAVTRDVHPRSLLDELVRLELAVVDASQDTVSLLREAFVPRSDRNRMLDFLGDNVGDHLRAAADNVLMDDHAHFEQAVFADGLSAASLQAMRPAIRSQWQALLKALVPQLELHVENDGQCVPAPSGRLRVGLYSYQEHATLMEDASEPSAPAERARKRYPAPASAAARRSPRK
jgi:hypothetical protein